MIPTLITATFLIAGLFWLRRNRSTADYLRIAAAKLLTVADWLDASKQYLREQHAANLGKVGVEA